MKLNKNIIIFLLFILVNFLSPWFWVLAKNPADFKINTNKLYQLKNEARIYEINTFRGEAKAAGLGILARLSVNKFTWFFKEISGRALESFDPYFLFFKGDLNIKRSSWVFGPVFWFLLPSVFLGFISLSEKQKRKSIVLLLLTAFFGAFFEDHYYSSSRIPIFLIFNWLAARGLINFFSKKNTGDLRFFKILYLLITIFEFFRFVHDFYFHYPSRLLG